MKEQYKSDVVKLCTSGNLDLLSGVLTVHMTVRCGMAQAMTDENLLNGCDAASLVARAMKCRPSVIKTGNRIKKIILTRTDAKHTEKIVGEFACAACLACPRNKMKQEVSR